MPQNKVTSETRRNILKVTSKKKKQDDKQRKITRKENTKTQYNSHGKSNCWKQIGT